MKRVRYACETALVAVMLGFFKCLSPQHASNLGGMIARFIGPLLSVNRRAAKHLKLALPGKSDAEYADIIRGMWDNLGRLFAEYPHLERIGSTCVEFAGMENFTTQSPAILISGHIANWEVAAASFFARDIPVDLIYRAPNNPMVNRMLQTYRSIHGKINIYPKSKTGMRKVVSALGKGHNVGILIDQKYNSGIPADFFGQTAMTSPIFIQLARKFTCPVYPVRVERLHGCHFRVSCFPPLNIDQPTETVIAEAHHLLESWISERPSQWIWLHRRWKA